MGEMSVLDRLDAVETAATKGPWACEHGPNDRPDQWEIAPLDEHGAVDWSREVADVLNEPDAAYIATARNTYRAMLEVARAAETAFEPVPIPAAPTSWGQLASQERARYGALLIRLRAALAHLEEVAR